MEIGDTATWVGAAAAIVTALFAAIIAFQVQRRERRQAIANIHVDLTTGETAQARNAIGTALYAPDRINAVDSQDAITALFKLYWAIQRAENTFRVYGIHAGTRRADGTRVEEFLSWNFREIAQNIADFHLKYATELAIEDDDAWQSFQKSLKETQPTLHNKLLAPKVARYDDSTD